jgi:MoaA/NifB/PqqE/SkfB family radical SAM enzyme
MSLKGHFVRKLATRKVARCLTGKPEDLKHLLELAGVRIHNPGLSAFLKRLSQDMSEGSGLANILLRIGNNANAVHKRRLVENLGFNWVVRGGRIRTGLRVEHGWVPFIIVVSPTMRCNLKCTGCYSALYSKDGELSPGDLEHVLRECKSIGCYFVVISGGEPFLLKDSLLRLFKRHRDVFFLVYTNGTLIDEDLAKAMARLGNVSPAISVEGYREQTDRRRGKGVYDKAARAMELLRRNGVLFGISVTYTRENVSLVTEDAFVEHYSAMGAMFGWYFMFMPVGKDPILDLVPTPEQRVACGRRVAELRKRHPMFLADFWNDGPAAAGCLAAGRRYLHILNSGRVEPCVYAHFGVDNIREKSLLEAANSPFFRALRREFPYNDIANLKRPCILIDNPEVLRKVVEEQLVPEGHDHAEDIIRDPQVRAWIDDYARRFRELTDPEWLKIIADPQSRWYRGNDEYKNLFRFRNAPQAGKGEASKEGTRGQTRGSERA